MADQDQPEQKDTHQNETTASSTTSKSTTKKSKNKGAAADVVDGNSSTTAENNNVRENLYYKSLSYFLFNRHLQ